MSKFTQKEIWMHNGFLGSAAFVSKAMIAIIGSRTATPEAKRLASEIQDKAIRLGQALKKRRED